MGSDYCVLAVAAPGCVFMACFSKDWALFSVQHLLLVGRWVLQACRSEGLLLFEGDRQYVMFDLRKNHSAD